MFDRYDENGVSTRKQVGIDCSGDEIIVEQSHKKEVDINQIVKKHGMDIIQKTAMLQTMEYQMDDISGNDFHEAMIKVTKAQETFDTLPHELRKKFDNSPAKYLDFVQNPANAEEMVALGIAQRRPEPPPVKVVLETPPTEPETPPV